MKSFFKIILIAAMLALTSCANLLNTIGQMELPIKLSEADVANGLKEALKVGTTKSVDLLSIENGFFSDELLKIDLPPEATVITDNIKLIPAGEKFVDDVILRLNRAAEDAVSESAPIFMNAISAMTIADAFNILHGPDDAATEYLKRNTYTELADLFKPKVTKSLDKVLIGNVSANDSWSILTEKYNAVAKSLIGSMAGLKTIDISLDDYVTSKALDGLFLKVATEEEKIRTDPLNRVTPLLKRVFGELDKE